MKDLTRFVIHILVGTICMFTAYFVLDAIGAPRWTEYPVGFVIILPFIWLSWPRHERIR